MKQYIVLYRAPLSVAERFAQATIEEAMEGMKLWAAWQQRIGDGLVDMGKPLGNAIRVTRQGVSKSDTEVIGMSKIQATSSEAAIDMVKNHHHLAWAENCVIDLLEEMPIPELPPGAKG